MQDQEFLLAVVNVVLDSSLSLQDQDSLLSKHYHTHCLNQTLPSKNLNRQPKEINNTLSLELEIQIKVDADDEDSKSETTTTDVTQFTESTPKVSPGSPSPQNISAVKSSPEGESRNISDSIEHSTSNGDHVNIIEYILILNI